MNYIGPLIGTMIAIFMCILFADLSSRDNFWDYTISISVFAVIGTLFEYVLRIDT
ncbi:hypothetical protein Acj9p056 [Acinetobacter phage Acj9]|uniref:Uncharacterized protein n=1 Tax=Acinetobacter phage Acj9 TaxID=760939 RepID=E5EPJ0_9CAUD|nr:hypothetical protein Acj9p056 [Acinetobacter phage Acj9]ADG59956.1 hypothetical protein Acj9p056 [Acinetobacter phage Acj9]